MNDQQERDLRSGSFKNLQTAFFASLVGFPKDFGAGSCSRESLEDFLHLWRVIGHYLSVEDREAIQ